MSELQKTLSSKIGGLARIKLHGNPGTALGRSLGGTRSLITHKNKKTAFKKLRKIASPSKSERLAELIGIFMGDGHVGRYQASVVTNAETDAEHAQYVSTLINQLFSVPVSTTRRADSNALVICVSSKEFCRLLTAFGMKEGNKVKLQIAMPNWVAKKALYRIAFIRGLFDTDGSVYLDRKTHRGNQYAYIGMMFSNRSLPLIAAFKNGLEALGLHPTQKTKYAVFLRRRVEVLHYFSVVGSSNPKHARKVEKYFSSGRFAK